MLRQKATTRKQGRVFRDKSSITQRQKQSSGAVWKLRWPYWAFRPNEPYGFCGRKATLRHWSQFGHNMSTDVRGHEALHHHDRNNRSSQGSARCVNLNRRSNRKWAHTHKKQNKKTTTHTTKQQELNSRQQRGDKCQQEQQQQRQRQQQPLTKTVSK